YLEQKYEKELAKVSDKIEDWIRSDIEFMAKLPSDNELTFSEEEMRNRVRASEIMERLLISCHELQGYLPSPSAIAIGFGQAAVAANKTTPDVQNTFDELCLASHSVMPYNLTRTARETRRKDELSATILRYFVTGGITIAIYVAFIEVLRIKGFVPAALVAAVAVVAWLIIAGKTGPKNNGPRCTPPIDTPVSGPEEDSETATNAVPRESELMKKLDASPQFCPQCFLQLEIANIKGSKRAYCTRCDKTYSLDELSPDLNTLVPYRCPRCETEMLLPEKAIHQLITCTACGRQSVPRHGCLRMLAIMLIPVLIAAAAVWFFFLRK
ncbi:MAG: hypothetical protein AB7F40_08220, partial [Victivallaceae bacterium]